MVKRKHLFIALCTGCGFISLLLSARALIVGVGQQTAEANYLATASAIAATNSYVNTMIDGCDDICRATGYTASCNRSLDLCGKVFTPTPTATLYGSTPMNSIDSTATMAQAKFSAAETVVAACHYMATQSGSDQHCPHSR